MICLLFCDFFIALFEIFNDYHSIMTTFGLYVGLYNINSIRGFMMLTVHVVLFDGFDLLDAIAPYEVFALLR